MGHCESFLFKYSKMDLDPLFDMPLCWEAYFVQYYRFDTEAPWNAVGHNMPNFWAKWREANES